MSRARARVPSVFFIIIIIIVRDIGPGRPLDRSGFLCNIYIYIYRIREIGEAF